MESTRENCYKQHAVIEFLVAVKEIVGNIRKWNSNVYRNAAVDRNTTSLEKKKGGGE